MCVALLVVADKGLGEVVEGGAGATGRVPVAVLGVVDLDELPVAVVLAQHREVPLWQPAAPILL